MYEVSLSNTIKAQANRNRHSHTVKLNIGGRHFEISRSLVDEHPGTMLAPLVSNIWHENPEESIFIDRDGEIFGHILNYLRYGSIVLPITIPREMLLREMDYYRICCNEECIQNESTIESIEFIAGAIRDKNIIDLIHENKMLQEKVRAYTLIEITGPDAHPVYARGQLDNKEKQQFVKNMGWDIKLQQLWTCSIEKLEEVELWIGGFKQEIVHFCFSDDPKKMIHGKEKDVYIDFGTFIICVDIGWKNEAMNGDLITYVSTMMQDNPMKTTEFHALMTQKRRGC